MIKKHTVPFDFKTLIVLLVYFFSLALQAQGDGPESHFLKPQKLWGLNSKYLHLNQNTSVNGDILTPNIDLEVNSFPITAFHVFSIKGQHTEIVAMMNPTSISSKLKATPISNSRSNSKNGFSDGFVGLKIGMINGKAANLKEYPLRKNQFFMSSYARIWYSGTYAKDEIVNIGTHRTTFEYGTPMTIPLLIKSNATTSLELFPSIRFFTKNKDVLINPITNEMADKTQAPLFIVEHHVIQKFDDKITLTLNGRYQLGGETTTNNTKDGNSFNNYGATLGVGYQFHPLVYLHADYGGLLFGDNGAESKMFRINLQLNYLKMNKEH